MKMLSALVLALFLISFHASAQIAFVDTKHIYSRIPAYGDSVAKINRSAAIWQKEIDDRQAVVDMMNVDFQRDEAMLSDSIKKERAEAIMNNEKSLRNLQRSRFGYQGDLNKLSDSLLGPLKLRVNQAIQAVTLRLGYKVVLDKSEGLTVLYFKPEFDISDEVVKELSLQ